MAKIKESVLVIKVAIGVKRAELKSLHQDHDKLIIKFVNLFSAEQKLEITQQSVIVNVEKRNRIVILKKQQMTNAYMCR